MSKKLPYKLIDSRKIYRGHIIELVKDRFILNRDREKVVTRELVRHPGAVVVIPRVDRRHILLLKQFRYAAQGDLWEVVAGTLERGEPTLRCAKRELEEETGFRAKRFRFVTRFLPAPGISDELMTLYIADGLYAGTKNLDHDEWIEHEVVSLRRAERMIRTGLIRDAKTILAILWVLRFAKV